MKAKGIKNLTFTQRLQIETLNNAGHSKKEIASYVGVSIRTIQREFKRGEYEHLVKKQTFRSRPIYRKIVRYSAQKAQDRYNYLCTSKGCPLKIGKDFELVNYINNRVKTERITPHAVWGQIKHLDLQFKTTISKQTLYNYIRLGIIEERNIGTHKRKAKNNKKAIKRVSRGVSIEKRPTEINKRNTFGHWEMDCVCGSTLATFLVMTERLTRQEIIFKMENQTQASVIKCLNKLEYSFGKRFKNIFKTITVDNGTEFLDYKSIENLFMEKIINALVFTIATHIVVVSVERMNALIER